MKYKIICGILVIVILFLLIKPTDQNVYIYEIPAQEIIWEKPMPEQITLYNCTDEYQYMTTEPEINKFNCWIKW